MDKKESEVKGKLSNGYTRNVYSVLDKLLRNDDEDFVLLTEDLYIDNGIVNLLNDNGFTTNDNDKTKMLRVSLNKREYWYISELNDNETYELPFKWDIILNKITKWCEDNPMEVNEEDEEYIEVVGDEIQVKEKEVARVYFIDKNNFRYYKATHMNMIFTSLDNNILVTDSEGNEVTFDTSPENLKDIKFKSIEDEVSLNYYNSDIDGLIKNDVQSMASKFKMEDKLKKYGILKTPTGELIFNNEKLAEISEMEKQFTLDNNYKSGKKIYSFSLTGDEVRVMFTSETFFNVTNESKMDYNLPLPIIDNLTKVSTNLFKFDISKFTEVLYDLDSMNFVYDERVNGDYLIEEVNEFLSNKSKKFYVNKDNKVVIDEVVTDIVPNVYILSRMGYTFDIKRQDEVNFNYEWEKSFQL